MTLDDLAVMLAVAADQLVRHPVTGKMIRAGECPVCLEVGGVAVEVRGVVKDHWYVPAEAGGILYAGPHCLLTR